MLGAWIGIEMINRAEGPLQSNIAKSRGELNAQ